MTNTNTTVTVHGVLAGAYRGNDARSMLWHASMDNGKTPVCKRVKADSLCDYYGTPPEITEPTCPHCRKRLGLK